MPDCKTSRGCPIGEDLAADPDIELFLREFFTAKSLYTHNEISSLLERQYSDLGLLDEPQFLMKLEALWPKLQAKIRKMKGKNEE